MKRPSSQSLGNRGRFTSLGVLIITTFSAFVAFGQAPETIYDAMREGKVNATFTATGGSSGDSIYLNISKTPAAGYGTLTITVPPGLRLQNLNGVWQSMVVSGVRGRWQGGNQYTPQPLIILDDASPSATYLLSAYCAEFRKDNPSPASQFVVWPPDNTTACILSNASAQGLSVAASQVAEWINTDRVTFNDLQDKFPVSIPDWNAAVRVASQCQQAQVQFQPPQTQQVAPGVQYNAPVTPTPLGALAGITDTWSEQFVTLNGTLYVSPDAVRFEHNMDKHGNPYKHLPAWDQPFKASCSQLNEWKANGGWNGFNQAMNALSYVPSNGWDWGFHIKLKDGKKHEFYANTKQDMEKVLQTISRACGFNQ